MKSVIIIMILIISFQLYSQTLEEFLQASERNFAISPNQNILSDMQKIENDAEQSMFYPQIYFSSSYRYQSESTEIALKDAAFEIEFPQQQEDSWQVSLQILETIYDGGITNRNRKLKLHSREVQKAAIRSRILQRKLETAASYYGLLLTQRQAAILLLQQENLNSEKDKITAGIDTGILEPTHLFEIEEEILQLSEEIFDLEFQGEIHLDKLRTLTGLKIERDFEAGNYPVNDYLSEKTEFPDIERLKEKRKIEMEQVKLSGSGLLPQLQFNAIAAYGNPGYNIFSDVAHDYYQASLNFNWNIWDWNRRQQKRRLHRLNAKILDGEIASAKESFKTKINECEIELNKYNEKLSLLEKRKDLLQRISSSYANKLTSGTISSSEYLHQFNKYQSCELEITAIQLQKEFTLVKKILLQGGNL